MEIDLSKIAVGDQKFAAYKRILIDTVMNAPPLKNFGSSAVWFHGVPWAIQDHGPHVQKMRLERDVVMGESPKILLLN